MISEVEIEQRVVTTDPDLHRQLLEFWDRPRPGVSIEDIAGSLGVHPDPQRGHVNSIFLLTTETGRPLLMWEPGPGTCDEHADEPEELDDNDNPWM